jgi:hypothetical protein
MLTSLLSVCANNPRVRKTKNKEAKIGLRVYMIQGLKF